MDPINESPTHHTRELLGRLGSWQTSHRQNYAELCVAAHHACVSLARFFERICFNHGTHPGQFGEAQSVLGIGRCSRGPALNGSSSKNELCWCDLNGIER